MADEEREISIEEAASRLGRTDRQVRRYCEKKRLKCEAKGKKLVVDADSVEALKKELQAQKESGRKRVHRPAVGGTIPDIEKTSAGEPAAADTAPGDTDIDMQPDVLMAKRGRRKNVREASDAAADIAGVPGADMASAERGTKAADVPSRPDGNGSVLDEAARDVSDSQEPTAADTTTEDRDIKPAGDARGAKETAAINMSLDVHKASDRGEPAGGDISIHSGAGSARPKNKEAVLPELQGDLVEIFGRLRTYIDHLEYRIRFERQRNDRIQASIATLVQKFGVPAGGVRKPPIRSRWRTRKLWLWGLRLLVVAGALHYLYLLF